MARPTTCDFEVLDKTKEYLVSYEDNGDIMPSVAGLAIHLGVGRQTIYDWKNLIKDDHVDTESDCRLEFSYILETLLAKQEQILFKNGLKGDFNAAITKLALGKHGYSDKQDNTLASPGSDTLNVNVRNEWNLTGVPSKK